MAGDLTYNRVAALKKRNEGVAPATGEWWSSCGGWQHGVVVVVGACNLFRGAAVADGGIAHIPTLCCAAHALLLLLLLLLPAEHMTTEERMWRSYALAHERSLNSAKLRGSLARLNRPQVEVRPSPAIMIVWG